MIKKIAIIFLIFLYLVPAIGVTVSAHSCDGKVTSVSFNSFDTKHKCSCGSKKMKKDCCKDQTTTIKIDDKQQQTQLVSCKGVKVTAFQPAISTNLTIGYKTPFLLTEPEYNAQTPPDDIKHPLYILHCVFRI